MPYRADREDLPALLDKARKVRPKLIYVANPDNPMGTYQRADELRDFIAGLPPDCVLLLDEAYIDFAPEDALLPLEVERAQVVRLRDVFQGARHGWGQGRLRAGTPRCGGRARQGAQSLWRQSHRPKPGHFLRWATMRSCARWCGK